MQDKQGHMGSQGRMVSQACTAWCQDTACRQPQVGVWVQRCLHLGCLPHQQQQRVLALCLAYQQLTRGSSSSILRFLQQQGVLVHLMRMQVVHMSKLLAAHSCSSSSTCRTHSSSTSSRRKMVQQAPMCSALAGCHCLGAATLHLRSHCHLSHQQQQQQ